MSNKKRISKRIQEIESKKIKRFYFGIDNAGIAASNASIALGIMSDGFFKTVEILNNFSHRIGRGIKVFSEYQYGIDFADINLTTNESLSFINDVIALTGIDDMESKVILTKMPEHTRTPLLELLKVGYNLNDAYELIKDTFKF
ncbi:MAG: hypothetical protein J6O88_05760 [Chryseobacterium sp.]|uniref:hypothetical protein n=1 Tax=Chryseobacterium sp. TaxID=1871047 RepID=UPI001B045D4C|nr:hypothetical protein [Chryseobacterium sp.]MBO6184188.1 hypothetical protein [Chryseobacterium sp.]